jgi:hypothetical protein
VKRLGEAGVRRAFDLKRLLRHTPAVIKRTFGRA